MAKNEAVEVEAVEVVENNEEKKDGFFGKVKKFVKKHGKKIAVGCGIAAGAAVGFALGDRHARSNSSDDLELIDLDSVDTTDANGIYVDDEN